MDYEVVVVGAGVVGLSCAYFLSQKFSALVIERHSSFGNETSSRNSEVIHSGIYYAPGSLKAKLCIEGNKELYNWCNQYNIPHKRTGKLIVATSPKEEEYLDFLFKRAQENGVQGVGFLSQSQIQKINPNIKSSLALFVPSTGIIDSHRLMLSLETFARSQGCDFAYHHEVIGIERKSNEYELTVKSKDGEIFKITSKIVVNSAGLESDTIAKLAGIDIVSNGYELLWAKGHYFRLKESKAKLFNQLVYPVPPENQNFLGIHITIELNGGCKLGPDLEILPQRVVNYEVPMSLKMKFYESISRFIVGIDEDDIYPDQAGIRPKLKSYIHKPTDFIICEESKNGLPNFINLIGIESPGLTSALPIGKYVSDIVNHL